MVIGLVSGCAVTSTQYVTEYPEPEQGGVYHKIKPGETLWRIAKTYDVAMGDIIKANSIPDGARIEQNQLVLIPGAHQVKDVVLDTEQTKNEFVWPVTGKVIKYFRESRDGLVNKGIDIETEKGQLVEASRTGRVVFADYLPGYGRTVILDHGDGYFSVYAHNAKLLVRSGDFVLKNKDIARVGESQNISYVHFQIRHSAVEDNPLYYLP
ncbi:MAG: peptidoglycan DD-metalloendopeptidase family protein [Candidatus Omnitrophica bacterium]|nr:peptidoglycan DD-metalloendopeptidase family protein [Candidatus Omnitrophota bacterium]